MSHNPIAGSAAIVSTQLETTLARCEIVFSGIYFAFFPVNSI